MKHLNRIEEFIDAFERLHPGLSAKALSINIDLLGEYEESFNGYNSWVQDPDFIPDDLGAREAIENGIRLSVFAYLKLRLETRINDHAYSKVDKDLALSIANLFTENALFSVTIGTNTHTSALDFIVEWNEHNEDEQIDLVLFTASV